LPIDPVEPKIAIFLTIDTNSGNQNMLLNKYIGFDIDSKKTVARIVCIISG